MCKDTHKCTRVSVTSPLPRLFTFISWVHVFKSVYTCVFRPSVIASRDSFILAEEPVLDADWWISSISQKVGHNWLIEQAKSAGTFQHFTLFLLSFVCLQALLFLCLTYHQCSGITAENLCFTFNDVIWCLFKYGSTKNYCWTQKHRNYRSPWRQGIKV